MAAIEPIDHLDWLSCRTAQDHAVRLCLASASVIPSDKKLQELAGEQIVFDLIGLAFHGRRVMERRNQKSALFSENPLWPVSKVAAPIGSNLCEVFGAIVHATELKVQWETPDLSPNPYQGRQPKFAGSVSVKSDEKDMQFPIGLIVASFFGNVLNKSDSQSKKEAE